MARTAQISKEKRQSIITLRHESQSIRNISRTLKVSSSAVAKTSKLYDETVSHENPELPLLQRISSSYQPQKLQPKQMLHRVQVTYTPQHQLFIGDCVNQAFISLYGRIAANKLQLKDTNKKKRLAWAKKHKQWTLDWWKSVLRFDESKCEIFDYNCHVFVGERMISACMVPTVKHGGGVSQLNDST